MNRKKWRFGLRAVFFVGAAVAIHAWGTSHNVGPDILPTDAALYSWGYYPVSELAWADRGAGESVTVVPLETDALKLISDGHVNEMDVMHHLVAVVSISKIALIDARSWETLQTFDTGESLWRIALAPNLNKIAFVTCPAHLASDCWLGILEVASGNIHRTAAKDVGAASTLSWHPDGKSLVYISTDNRIISYVISKQLGHEIGKGAFAGYSPDGLKLAYEAEYDIVIRDMRTGQERRFTADWWDLPGWRFADESQYYSLHWHRAGRFLAFTADVMKVLPDDLVSPGVYSCNVLDVENGDYATLFDERGGTCGPWIYK